MVNADMFKDAFRQGSPQPQQQSQPQYIANPNYVAPRPAPAPSPVPQMAQPQYEDPEIAKLKFFFLKWLSLLIGGAAILLIVWRIILKFI